MIVKSTTLASAFGLHTTARDCVNFAQASGLDSDGFVVKLNSFRLSAHNVSFAVYSENFVNSQSSWFPVRFSLKNCCRADVVEQLQFIAFLV